MGARVGVWALRRSRRTVRPGDNCGVGTEEDDKPRPEVGWQPKTCSRFRSRLRCDAGARHSPARDVTRNRRRTENLSKTSTARCVKRERERGQAAEELQVPPMGRPEHRKVTRLSAPIQTRPRESSQRARRKRPGKKRSWQRSGPGWNNRQANHARCLEEVQRHASRSGSGVEVRVQISEVVCSWRGRWSDSSVAMLRLRQMRLLCVRQDGRCLRLLPL